MKNQINIVVNRTTVILKKHCTNAIISEHYGNDIEIQFNNVEVEWYRCDTAIVIKMFGSLMGLITSSNEVRINIPKGMKFIFE